MRDATINAAAAQWDVVGRSGKRYVSELGFLKFCPYLLPANRPRSERTASVRLLTFPAAAWAWERHLSGFMRHTYGADAPILDMHGIEEVAAVHRKMRDTARKLSASHGKAGMLKFRSLPCQQFIAYASRFGPLIDKPYDVVYLDWLGTWSQAKAADITALFSSGILAPKSTFILTLGLDRGRSDCWKGMHTLRLNRPFPMSDLREEPREELPHWVTEGVARWVVDEAAKYGRKVKPVALHAYRSYTTAKGSPQQTTVFRVG